MLALAALGGCLSRKVATGEPTTKISFENVVPQPAIDKVDLLVLVDQPELLPTVMTPANSVGRQLCVHPALSRRFRCPWGASPPARDMKSATSPGLPPR